MNKKNKMAPMDPSVGTPDESGAAKKQTTPKKRAAGAATRSAKKAAAKKSVVKKGAAKKAAAKKRSSGGLNLSLPLAKARKLAGDLYEAAGLALWTEAIASAEEPKKSGLVQLQDSICDAADFLREAKASNPQRLHLFWVACLDRHGLPSTKPRFVTAATEEEALAIWREAFKGEYGRRRPHAWPVPELASAPGVHD
ncbi:hypothetical protein [Rhodoblastus sp.]|jgi:hypothetical protein|uniref:hypothetical protein n=1 Tax=Rhodoblastus sp. TaxID=1962975 RepID=UPI0025F08FB6|nr:hypothetical protein [Rhodoblastus sp.]